MGRINNLIPLLTDLHTFACMLAIPPVRATEKPSQKTMLFFNIEKNIDYWDGLGRGERSEGQSKPHSNGLIQLLQSMCQLPVLSVLGEQLFVRAALDDAAVFEDHDGIGVADGG